MMTIKRFALAAILFCTPALAQQWAPAEYNSEYEACVPACDKNNPTAHSGCQNYCHCVMDMLQSQFPNHAQINADFEAKKPETMSSVQNIANTCNRKFFGGDARKVQ
jgi:hypothetical protein